MSYDTEARARRRAEIERMLARYPHLDPEACADLAAWFSREASALDVAMLASTEHLAQPYQAFRKEHLDPLRPRDWLRGALFAALCIGVLSALVWPAL